MDNRIKQLASNLVNYSCHLEKGENVLISATGTDCYDLVRAIVEEVYKAGAYPHVEIKEPSISRALALGAKKEQYDILNDYELYKMKKMQAYIGIRAGDNLSEMSDVPGENLEMMNIATDPLLRQRVDKSKWVILRYPNGSMAQAARRSKEAFEDFYFKVCNLDYAKMAKAMEPLRQLMEKTDRVRLVAKDTDLSFSIKGISAVSCAGECNIPDGEVYTAPVRDSINGVISYNAQSLYQGTVFDNVRLTFKDGKIIEATANNTEKLNQILDTDEGARYVGEFAIGVNPYVTEPMLDILFDEKIDGSLHFTPGAAYEDAYNGNNSSVHWDLVLIQRSEYGGGEIYFDDVLIRKDGIFVLDELLCLNPENLK